MLRGLASDPPARAARVLSRLLRSALHPASGVPPKLRAALFSDAAVDQLVQLSAGAHADGSAEAQAADCALEILSGLATDAAYGLVSASPGTRAAAAAEPNYDDPGTADAAAAAAGNAGAGGGGQGRAAASAGQRVVRLLRQLQAANEPRHARLLVLACRLRPGLAAAYLDKVPFALDPRPSPRWFASMAVLSQLVEAAARLPPPGAPPEDASQFGE